MILDENFDLEIKKAFKFSSKGDFLTAKMLEFLPPQPNMARETFKMGQYFSAMNKEVASFVSSMTNTEAIKNAQEQKVLSGKAVEAIHEEYKDGDKAEKERKLQEIEADIDLTTQMLNMCGNIDLYALVTDFGKMVVYAHRCFIKAVDDDSKEKTEPMTMSLWENNVSAKDRLAAAIRYCCFFGLTSSLEG